MFACDETNTTPVLGQFFIYGGVVVDDVQLATLSARVDEIREQFGFLPGDSLKFATAHTPNQVGAERARLAKKAVVKTLEGIGARMIVYVVLHDIAMKVSEAERMQMALNVVATRFHDLLTIEDGRGVMVIDRAENHFDHLSHLYQHGNSSKTNQKQLSDRILHFGMSNDNASNVSSAADIALGAFRYCVNTAGGRGSEHVAREMYPPIARMIWGVRVADEVVLDHYGYNQYPREVRKPEYAERYSKLVGSLATYSGAGVGLARAA
jgi:hypothetical protein